MSGESKEPTTTTATLEEEGEGLPDKITPSLVSLLLSHHKRVSLLRRIFSFHKSKTLHQPSLFFETFSQSNSTTTTLDVVPMLQPYDAAESCGSSRRAALNMSFDDAQHVLRRCSKTHQGGWSPTVQRATQRAAVTSVRLVQTGNLRRQQQSTTFCFLSNKTI